MSDLFSFDERKYIQETVTISQQLHQRILEEQRIKLKQLKVKKEEERLEYVKQVKFRQYL